MNTHRHSAFLQAPFPRTGTVYKARSSFCRNSLLTRTTVLFAPAQRAHRVSPQACVPLIEEPVLTQAAETSATQPSGIELGFVSVPEVTTPLSLEVIGELPSFLGTGRYYRNGPGLFEEKHKDGQEYVAEHWLDALGMVHAFFLDAQNGTVHYRSRLICDAVRRTVASVPKDRYVAVNISHKYQPVSLIDRLLKSFGPMTMDPETGKVPFNPSVTLQELPTKGILNASTDANVLCRLDPETLEIVEDYDFTAFNSELTNPLSSAHGMLDPATGEYFNFVKDYGVGKVDCKVFRIKPSGETEIMTSFKDYPFYTHSFSLTDNYVIIVLWPCEVNLFKLLQKKSFVEACRMKPSTLTKFVVISRQSNQIVCTYEHAPFYCFHTINAFERDDNIIIDLSYYEDLKILSDLRLDYLKADGDIANGIPVRFTLPRLSEAIAAGPASPSTASSEMLAKHTLEFGSVAPSKKCKPHRFIYGVSNAQGTKFQGDLVKLDVETGDILQWSSPHSYTGEPMFVANPNGQNEDDGVLIVVVLDAKEKTSYLVVIETRMMAEVARAIVPMPLPLGFHGFYQG